MPGLLAVCSGRRTLRPHLSRVVGLLARESKTALLQVLILGACLLAALMFFTLGYLFLVGSAVVAVATAAEVSWVSVALAAGGLHFVLAIICLLVAHAKMVTTPFPDFRPS